MRTDYHEKRFLAKGQEVSMGIDVHKESWQTTIRAEGEEVFHGRLPSQYQALKKLIERLPGCTVKVEDKSPDWVCCIWTEATNRQKEDLS